MRTLIALLFSFSLSSQVFDGAVGYGSNWTFTSDYDVRIVTNLNASGSGSLESAVETATSKAGIIVVFNGLSGTITLNTALNLQANKQVYIAGQTSENGILLRMTSSVNNPLVYSASGSKLIVRDIVFAVGPTCADCTETTPFTGLPSPSAGSGDATGNVNGDNVTLTSGSDYIFDRCTFLWSTDESINPYGTSNITFQNCIIAESLMYATHQYTVSTAGAGYFAPHSMGMIIGLTSNNITIYNTLWSSNNQRNPLIQWTGSGQQNFEMVNSVVSNWGANPTVAQGGSHNLQFINVVYDNGPNSSARRPILVDALSGNSVYVKGCYDDVFRTSAGAEDWDVVGQDDAPFTNNLSTAYRRLTPHPMPLQNQAEYTRTQTIDTVKAYAGTSFQIAHETRIKNLIESSSNALIDDPSDVGGYPSIAAGTIITDSDNDGIPDDQEFLYGNNTFQYVNELYNTAAPVNPDPGPGGGETPVKTEGASLLINH